MLYRILLHNILVLCLYGADGAHDGKDIVIGEQEGLPVFQCFVQVVPKLSHFGAGYGNLIFLGLPINFQAGLKTAYKASFTKTGSFQKAGTLLFCLKRQI